MKIHITVGILILVVLVTICYVLVNNNPRNIPPPGLVVWQDQTSSRTQKTEQMQNTQPVSPTKASSCPGGNGHVPDEKILDSLPLPDLLRAYQDYGSNMEVICKQMLRMGKIDDGGWEVCNDEPVRPRKNCLVYSFGINNDFSFDDMVGQHYGCEVHAFDPSMKQGDTKRSEKVMFHHLGVYGTNGVINNNWPVKTIAEIKKMLGHTNTHIDVLKMDIEGSEWSTLDTATKDGSLKNVSQFLIEFHNFGDDKTTVNKFRTIRALRDLGFRIFYAHKNFQCGIGQKTETPKRTACHELHMIHIPACEVK